MLLCSVRMRAALTARSFFLFQPMTLFCGVLVDHDDRVVDLKVPTLKGLGHEILGNFSTDRMVIELTKISK